MTAVGGSNVVECPAVPDTWAIWAICVVVGWAAIVDWRRREIPHAACVAVLICGIGLWLERGDVWPTRVVDGLLGAALSGGLVGLLYYLGGVAGGDLKLFLVLGLAVGLAIAEVLLWTALFGALMAAVAAGRKQRDFPYGPAIFAAIAAYALAPNTLWRLAMWEI